MADAFRTRILAVRKGLKLSQVAFAGKVGVDPSTVSRWETGKAQPDADQLRSLAEKLGVTADWLLCIDPSASSAA